MKYFVLVSLFISQVSFAIIPHKHSNKFLKKKKFKKHRIKGGAMDGGGSGANFPESGAAWFYQDNPKGYISVCIKRETNFKASYDEVKTAIQTSFKKWDDYIIKSDIYPSSTDTSGRVEPYPQKMKILTKIKIKEQCSKDTDLTFYFGLIDKTVQEILDNMVSPKAFAYRNYKDIDAIKGTSKGLVYIFSPKPIQQDDGSWDATDVTTYDWSKPNRLLAITMHEVGHIMGVPHIERTIMESDFKWVFGRIHGNYTNPEEGKRYANYLKTIDHDSQVLTDLKGISYIGSMGKHGSQEEKDTFKFFTGKQLVGKSKIQFKPQINDPNKIDVIISDDQKSFKYDIKTAQENTATHSMNDIPIFKRVRKEIWSSTPWGNSYDYETDYEINPKFIIHTNMTINQKQVPVDMSINMGFSGYSEKDPSSSYWIDSPITLFYTHPKKQKRMVLSAEIIRTFEIMSNDDEVENQTDIIIGK